jgi:hypothetical protein
LIDSSFKNYLGDEWKKLLGKIKMSALFGGASAGIVNSSTRDETSWYNNIKVSD